jgi:hypothetical protein
LCFIIYKIAYQFIVISISDERKKNIEKQFSDLEIKTLLTFLESPSTIANSSDYLPKHVNDRNILIQICVGLSHLRALEAACKPDAPEFSVICEDDVALHKTQFINGIEEIISNWDTHIAPDKLASIGWVPCNNYEKYIQASSSRTLKCVLGSKILHDRFVPGLQAYIVRKKDILPLIKHFIHPTFDIFKEHINSIHFPELPKNNSLIAIDNCVNKMLGQAVVFPPLAIEQVTPSLIGHDNVNVYWNVFFKDYECIKKNYYSF